MQKLPASWTKSSPKQLSFEEELFAKPSQEDLFYENFLLTLRNAKFLRYRLDHSTFKREQRVRVYPIWSDILEIGAKILHETSRKSKKYRHVDEYDILKDVFINKIDWAIAEVPSKGEIKQHHDNVAAKISGMFLAYSPVLKKQKVEVKRILQLLEESKSIIY